MRPQTLDQEIVEAGALISLLLVFVFAYFSALLPLFEDLRHRPKPPAQADQRTLLRQVSTYRALAWGLFAIILLVLGLLGPLSWRALNAQLWTPFQTMRVGLLLVDVLLLITGIGVVAEIILLTKRQRELT